MSTHNPVGWFEIYVQDMDRARTFYEAVFQVQLNKLNAKQPEMWAFPNNMERYGTGGALCHVPGMPSGNNSTIVYFSCVDCAVESARAADNGGTVVKPRFSIGEYGFISLVLDTEGNMIGLHSRQ